MDMLKVYGVTISFGWLSTAFYVVFTESEEQAKALALAAFEADPDNAEYCEEFGVDLDDTRAVQTASKMHHLGAWPGGAHYIGRGGTH